MLTPRKIPGEIQVDEYRQTADFIAGEFGLRGSTNSAPLQTYCELFQIQLATGESPFLQFLLFQWRLLRLLPRLLRRPAP